MMKLAAAVLLAAVSSASAAGFDFDGRLGLLEFPKAKPPVSIQAVPAPAEVVAAPRGDVIPRAELFAKLSAADIVYVGERHDQASHHLVQAEVLKALRRPGTVLAMEMLDFTQQAQLDAYLSGKMSEEEFAAFWKKAWGYAFEIYKPVFAFARENGVKGRALNAPISVIRQIAKGGLSSLTPEQRKLLPARVDPIRDERYLKYVKDSIGGHGQADPAREARMLEAMAAWNETMGQNLVDALKDGGSVVVIAGMGHMLYDAGILESVRNRAAPKQAVVLPYPLDGESLPLDELLRNLQKPGSEDIALGDYFWLLPK